jgi:hypothetical protein
MDHNQSSEEKITTDWREIDETKVEEILKVLASDEVDPEIEKLEKEILDETPPVVENEIAPPKKKKNYLNNKDLLAEVLASKAQGGMTHNLAVMLQTLCKRYAKKGQYANYSYNEDMQSYAVLMLVKTWHAFNEKRGKNPFAFFTQCVKNSFKQYLNIEKKQTNIKNETLISMGLSPSYNYLTEYEEERKNAKLGAEEGVIPTSDTSFPNSEVTKEVTEI